MEQIIDSLTFNTKTGSVYVILKNENYKHKQLKYFLNFKDEKVYFVGTEKNKTIFKNTEDIEKINTFLIK